MHQKFSRSEEECEPATQDDGKRGDEIFSINDDDVHRAMVAGMASAGIGDE